MSKCVVDEKPVNGAMLCRGCTAELERAIKQVVDLAEQLALTVTRQAVMGAQQGMPHVKDDERPLPFNAAASEIEWCLRATLVPWLRDLVPSPSGQPADSLVTISAALLALLPAIRQHPAADEIHDEITFAVKEAWKAIDRPAFRARVEIGECLNVGCIGMLTATFPTEDYNAADETTHAAMTCSGCQESYPAEQWLRVGTRIRHRMEAV